MIITILATGQKIEATVRAEKISYPLRYYTMNGRPNFKTHTIQIIETNDEIQDFDGLTELGELDGKYYLCGNRLIEVQKSMTNTKPTIDTQTIKAIMQALKNGLRVEILQGKDGEIIIQTVQRKRLKTE